MFYSHREFCGAESQSVVLSYRKTIRIFIQHYVCKHRIEGKSSGFSVSCLFLTWWCKDCANALIWHIIFSPESMCPLSFSHSLPLSLAHTGYFATHFSWLPLLLYCKSLSRLSARYRYQQCNSLTWNEIVAHVHILSSSKRVCLLPSLSLSLSLLCRLCWAIHLFAWFVSLLQFHTQSTKTDISAIGMNQKLNRRAKLKEVQRAKRSGLKLMHLALTGTRYTSSSASAIKKKPLKMV